MRFRKLARPVYVVGRIRFVVLAEDNFRRPAKGCEFLGADKQKIGNTSSLSKGLDRRIE
jgi:hypothetical protein